jgi:branched-chain amino acid aminotransferase
MIYLDLGGQGPGLVPAAGAALPIGDRGFLLGDGLFETVRLSKGQMDLLPLHLRRLQRSADALGIPCDPPAIGEAARAVAAHHPGGEGAMRITLSRGTGNGRGYAPPPAPAPTLLITTTSYRPPSAPLQAVTASFMVNRLSPLTQHKTLSALEKVIARSEAVSAGADEALLLNGEGRVVEASAANIFIYSRGSWFTPPLSEGCLPGVMRAQVIHLTGAQERPLTMEALFNADGVYLTNALMGCLSLASIDGRALPISADPPAFTAHLFKPL